VIKQNEMKINAETSNCTNILLYTAFSSIPLDIEGSNLENTGWMPSESDIKYMGEENYKLAVEECNLKNSKVMFKNVSLRWDSCDCGDGYGCSHGSYVYEIHITNGEEVYKVEYEDGDYLYFEGNGKMVKIPVVGSTIYDFIRACELCEIELQLSDYAVSLLK
jgi:hypothetical protein